MEHYLYILDDAGEPVPTNDLVVWGAFMESDNRIIKREAIGPLVVSTVFLGIFTINNCLFEILVFVQDGSKVTSIENSMSRYTTYADALKGHDITVDFIRRHLQPVENLPDEFLPVIGGNNGGLWGMLWGWWIEDQDPRAGNDNSDGT